MELLTLFLCFLISYASARFPLNRGGGLKAPYLPKDTPMPEAQWIEQKQDHLSNTANQTWQQRYFVNSTWWNKTSGPVFFLLGGEGPSDPAWIVADTNIMLNAMRYQALVFSIEHR